MVPALVKRGGDFIFIRMTLFQRAAMQRHEAARLVMSSDFRVWFADGVGGETEVTHIKQCFTSAIQRSEPYGGANPPLTSVSKTKKPFTTASGRSLI